MGFFFQSAQSKFQGMINHKMIQKVEMVEHDNIGFFTVDVFLAMNMKINARYPNHLTCKHSQNGFKLMWFEKKTADKNKQDIQQNGQPEEKPLDVGTYVGKYFHKQTYYIIGVFEKNLKVKSGAERFFCIVGGEQGSLVCKIRLKVFASVGFWIL